MFAESDSDDETVEEFDVIWNDSIEDELYVVQYPTVPAPHPFNSVRGKSSKNSSPLQHISNDTKSAQAVAAQYRSHNQQLRLQFDTFTDTPHFQDAQNEQGQVLVEDDLGLQHNASESKQQMLRQMTMSSHTFTDSSVIYAVAAVSRETMTMQINPVKSVLQMTPDLSTLDVQADAAEAMVSVELNEEEKRDRMEMEEVEVRIGRKETERTSHFKEQSFSTLRKRAEKEPWVKLNIVSYPKEEEVKKSSKKLIDDSDEEIDDEARKIVKLNERILRNKLEKLYSLESS